MNQQNCPTCDEPTWFMFGALYNCKDILMGNPAVAGARRIIVLYELHECKPTEEE